VPFGALGIWVLWRKPEVKLLLALVLVYAASVILFFVTARFRMPTVPWFSWLAAGGLVWLVQTLRGRGSLKRLLPLLILTPAAVLAFIDVWQLREAPIGWARFMEGNAYMRLNQPDSARAAFLDAIYDNQSVTRAYLNLGVIEYQAQNYAAAELWYEKAIQSDSTNNYGTVRESQGDTSRAIAAYKRAIALYPLADDARENLAGTYFRLGVRALKVEQDSIAIVYLDSSRALHPDPAAYYNRALALMRLGRNDQAIESINHALSLDPDLESAHRLREILRSGATSPPIGSGPP
jgi:tetratricopeptide (TPR) repeat protein